MRGLQLDPHFLTGIVDTLVLLVLLVLIGPHQTICCNERCSGRIWPILSWVSHMVTLSQPRSMGVIRPLLAEIQHFTCFVAPVLPVLLVLTTGHFEEICWGVKSNFANIARSIVVRLLIRIVLTNAEFWRYFQSHHGSLSQFGYFSISFVNNQGGAESGFRSCARYRVAMHLILGGCRIGCTCRVSQPGIRYLTLLGSVLLSFWVLHRCL